MSRIRLVASQLGIDGWVLGLTALAAIAIGLLDFTDLVSLTPDPVLRMILVAVGLTMAAIVSQAGKRSADIKELSDALQATATELISDGAEFHLHVVRSVLRARRFILDTTLNAEHAALAHPADDRNHYHYSIYQRVQKGEISYRRVEIIFSKERLEYAIMRLLVYEGLEYYIRYYDPPPRPIPVLNIMSFDNEAFYVGGFYSSDAPADLEHVVYIRNLRIGQLLDAYWNNLWHSAKPLNESKRINWDELRSIANRIGMTNPDFDSLVSQWKDEIQRRKRRTR